MQAAARGVEDAGRRLKERSDKMEVRMLQREEHGRTRELWERVFAEDTKEFLDYYYTVKTLDNEMYVIEQEHQICSMIQLNPYEMRINDSEFLTHYIIAVATEERFRKRGFMGALLQASLKKMYDRKETFTFLMPAAESIYHPYDFRYIYRQRGGKVCGSKERSVFHELQGNIYEMREASEKDCRKLAEFAEEILRESYQVVAVRTEQYYRRMLAEQKSEHGGIGMIEKNGKLVGSFFFAKEETYEIREPLLKKGEEEALPQAVFWLTKGNEAIFCDGWNLDVHNIKKSVTEERDRPLIMARLLYLPGFFESLRPRTTFSFTVEVTDPILEENNRRFLLESDGTKIAVSTASKENDTDRQISIAALTQILFGWVPYTEEKLPEVLQKDLNKIEPADGVFLNEIV